MVSRENKRTALYEKLQLLRAVTNSHAKSDTSIIVDAAKYIEELKEKVEILNQDIASAEAASASSPRVTVETLDKGFLVNVTSEKNCPGLLVSILEAFEELGLSVAEARVSCGDNFQLEAVGGENEVDVNAETVEQAVLDAVKTWSERCDQQD